MSTRRRRSDGPSVGSVGDSYDSSPDAVEFDTLECVDRFSNRRFLEPIGSIPPAEAEERYYAQF